MLVKFAVSNLVVSLILAWYVGMDRLERYVRWAASDPDFFRIPVCLGMHCATKMGYCLADTDCRATLTCINECQLFQPRSKQAMCAYICEMTDGYENEAFEDVMNCMIEGSCISNYPKDGYCVADNEDGDKSLTDLKQLEGDWWVIRGLNCGYDEVFPGGYDWFPCQHERYQQTGDGKWINKISYCAGSDDKCLSKGGGAGIRTIANVTLHKPGILRHEYDSALAPQIEYWRIVSRPDEDHMLLYWCGKIPIQEYNGGLLLSRHRSDKSLTPESRAELQRVAKKFNLNFDDMCASNNDWCPEN